MNLDCKQSIAAQYEIVSFLAVGGEDLIDDIAKLKHLLSLKLRTIKFGGEFTWDWAADLLIRVRLLPSYSQIRSGLAENAISTLMQLVLPQLKTEAVLNESIFDWALCVWLLCEISILKTPITDEVVAVVFEPLSKNSGFMDRVMFLAQHFISSKGTSAGAIFSLPFLMHMVRLYPDDARIRLDVARAQIDAGQFYDALGTLLPIDIDGSDLPGQVPYCGEADLLAEESFLRGRAVSLINRTDYTSFRRYPYLSDAKEARSALNYAVAEYGHCHPEYWHGLGQQLLDEARREQGFERYTWYSEGIRCLDTSLEVAHLQLLTSLQSQLEFAQGELLKLLTGPIMKASIQRQELRVLRSTVEWAREHNELDTIQYLKSDCQELLVRKSDRPKDWAESCVGGSYLTNEMDFDDFQSKLLVEACRVLYLFGVDKWDAKFLNPLANDASDKLVQEVALETIHRTLPKGTQPPFDSPTSEPQQRIDGNLSIEENRSSSSPWDTRLVVYLKNKGTLEFPQFVIARRDGKVWDGFNWSDNDNLGEEHSDINEAAQLCQEMQREAYEDVKTVQVYKVPIQVEVRADSKVQPHDIQAWLQKSLELQCRYDKHGAGPTINTLVTVDVKWSDFMHVPKSE